jgi:PAS domain S-box-containing protein
MCRACCTRWSCGPDGRLRFLYISRQTTSLFGVPAEVATDDNTDPFSVVHRDDRAGLWQTVQASARDLSPWRHEFRLWRKGSTALWVLGNSSPQRAPDGRIIWHGYLQDVTERRELEEARHAAAVAAAASRAKSDFLSRMSHELRTPLNAVLGFAQLMEIDDSDPPSDGQRRRLTHIRDAGDHLLQMIGELLDLTRIESGSMTLSHRTGAACARWRRKRWPWCSRRLNRPRCRCTCRSAANRWHGPTARGCARCC